RFEVRDLRLKVSHLVEQGLQLILQILQFALRLLKLVFELLKLASGLIDGVVVGAADVVALQTAANAFGASDFAVVAVYCSLAALHARLGDDELFTSGSEAVDVTAVSVVPQDKVSGDFDGAPIVTEPLGEAISR